MDLMIKNALLVDPAAEREGTFDIAIQEGKICEVAPHLKRDAQNTLDAKGRLVCPGLIDLHFHFPQPLFNFFYKKL